MRFLRHTLQLSYYALNASMVRMLGGIKGLKGINRLARLLGGLRYRIGYIGCKPQDYVDEFTKCFPESTMQEQQVLLQEFWHEHQRRFLELFIIRDLRPEIIHNLFDFKNLGEIDRALKMGKGVVLPVPHFGNVRLHHVALAVIGYPISVLSGAYEMEPKSVQKAKLEAESKLHDVGSLSQGTAWMVKALKRGDILQIASTAEGSSQGVWVELLGRSFYFPSGWIRLARATGAPVIPSLNYRLQDGRYMIEMLPTLHLKWTGNFRRDYEANAQRLMDIYQPYYRSMPEMIDWMYWLVRCREAEKLRGGEGIV